MTVTGFVWMCILDIIPHSEYPKTTSNKPADKKYGKKKKRYTQTTNSTCTH